MEYRCINNDKKQSLYISFDDYDKNLLCTLAPSLQILFNESGAKKISSDFVLSDSARYLLFEIILDAAEQSNADIILQKLKKSDELLIEICRKSNNEGEKSIYTVLKVECETNAQIGNDFLFESTHKNSKIKVKNQYVSQKSRIKIKRRIGESLYLFDNFFDAYDCISALIIYGITPKKCTLFSLQNIYYINMHITAEKRGFCRKIMSEFGEKSSINMLPVLQEHGTLICADFYNEVFKISTK